MSASGHTSFLPGIYGGIHAVVDASTAMVVFSSIGAHDTTPLHAFWIVLGYDLLAFGLQAPFGLLTDRLRAPRAALLTGLGLTLLAFAALYFDPYAAMVLAGAGNALFHVGAGTFTLFTNPGRATDPGIFVAPGALGLAFGIWLGKGGNLQTWPFIVALALSVGISLLVKNPTVPYRLDDRPPPPSFQAGALTIVVIMSLLLVSITVRSLVGFAGCHRCPRGRLMALGLPFVACAGKGMGGIVADRMGWIETTMGALLLSAPLIAFSGGHPGLILPGLLLFQMTMPVTLVAVVMLFPRLPAFAFGLCCVALVLGAVPTFFSMFNAYYGPLFFLALILFSTTAVFLGLRWLGRSITGAKPLTWLYG